MSSNKGTYKRRSSLPDENKENISSIISHECMTTSNLQNCDTNDITYSFQKIVKADHANATSKRSSSISEEKEVEPIDQEVY